MRGRNALIAGFGLGGLAVLTIVLFAGGSVRLPASPAAGRAQSSSSPQPPLEAPSGRTATPTLPPTAPGARAGAAMVYDPENHGIILFGGSYTATEPDGHNDVVTAGDTWLWDGKSWRRLDVQGPPARDTAMAAYDSVRHVIVLFGGSGPAGAGQAKLFQDTWTWNGGQWEEQRPAHSPNPRMRAGIAFDEVRGVVVMFGGEGEGTTTDDATWTWNGVDWTLLDPTTVPPARHFASMAFDAARGVTVLFGGSMGGARFNDTWTWDGANWTRQPGPAPAASGWSWLAYDAATKEGVAYVYYALDNHPVAEYTITWDGTSRTDRTTAGDPSPRAEPRLAYDPDSKQVVLYGPNSELWTWDGANWSLWRPDAGA